MPSCSTCAAGEFEGEQLDARFVAVGGVADDADELVEVGQRDEIAFERLGALLGLPQFEARAAQDHFAAMLDVAVDELLESEQLRAAVVDGELLTAKEDFQRGVLVEIVDDDLRIRVALEFDDDAGVLVRFVAHVGDFGETFLVDQLGDALDQRRRG